MRARDLSSNAGDLELKSSIPSPPFRWQTRVLLPAVLVLSALAILIGSGWKSLFPGHPVQVVAVLVKRVQGTAGEVTVTASGWLEPDPFPIYAAALAGGVVQEVTVLEGEAVRKGQVLARLVADDAKISLREAEAELAMAAAEVDRAKADLASKQEVLESLIDRRNARIAATGHVSELEATLGQLTSTIESDEARLSSLEDERERKRALADSGAVSRGEYQRLSLRTAAQRKALEATRKQQPVLEARLVQARSGLAAAEEHLSRTISERHQVNLARADLLRAEAARARSEARRDEARLRLNRMEIRSPRDGIVLERLVSPGSRLVLSGTTSHGTHVAHLYDPKSLQVRVDVPLADAASVGLGQNALIEIQVLPDKQFRGRITRLLHQADIQKNTVEVKVALDDPDPVLKPEMLARVRFLASEAKSESRERIFAPQPLLGKDSTTWVVESRKSGRGVARRRNVIPGKTVLGDWQEVTSGLQPGDLLIADPPENLHEGDAVIMIGEGWR